MVKQQSKPAAAPLAYSYIRFSHIKQADGDSVRRQTAAREAWCQKTGVKLDESTSPQDEGKGAFKQAKQAQEDAGMASIMELEDLVTPDRRALRGFIEMIRQRKIPRGSYLIVENLDRLSRDDVIPAVNLIT